MIYILLDSSLTAEERQEIARATEDTRQVFPGLGVETVASGDSERDAEIRKKMDSYIEGTQQENGRYDASVILRRMKALAEWKKDAEVLLMFTGRDLYLSEQKISWCFGAGRLRSRVAVSSVYRFRELTAPERRRCIERTMWHEIGHALGLAADLARKNTERKSGPHCTAPGCSMRQTESLAKLLAFSKEEEMQEQCFCPDCMADLRKRFEKE